MEILNDLRRDNIKYILKLLLSSHFLSFQGVLAILESTEYNSQS